LPMANKTVEQELDEAEAMMKTLESIAMPPTIKGAAKEKWEATFESRVELAANAAYPAKEQAADRQRVVRVEDVLELLELLEDAQIEFEVTGPIEVIADAAVAIYKLYVDLLIVAGKVVRAMTSADSDISDVLVEAAKKFLVITSALEVKKRLKEVFRLRDENAAALRELALPQRVGTRHVRYKVTREI